MLRLKQLFYFCILILNFEPLAQAENNLFIKTVNGITKSRNCGFVKKEDLKNLACSNRYPHSLISYFNFNEEIFEWSVFQSSAELQLRKNLCIEQRTTEIMKSDDLYSEWFKRLTFSWLGQRKAQLMVSHCAKIKYNTNERLGARLNAEFTPRASIDKKWLDICENEEKLDQIAAADGIFQYSLPAISGSEFFDIMKDNREVIRNKKTGKAITDQEILETDFSGDINKLFYLSASRKDQIKKKIKESIAGLVNERKAMNTRLEGNKNKRTGNIYLSDADKDYIFDDDTVNEYLLNSGHIPNEHTGKGRLSTGAKCILNRYESNFGAELAEMLLFSLSYGVGNLKNVKLEQFIKMKNFGKMLLMGSFPAGLFIGLQETIKVCSSDKYTNTKIIDQAKGQTKALETGDKLPKDFAYTAYDIDIPEEKTPACQGLPKNVIINDFKRSNCLTNALLSLGPMQLALPVLGFTLAN
ncbi:MAG: hypothetical protein AABY53_05515 [Bdellovibrionota bacterium]